MLDYTGVQTLSDILELAQEHELSTLDSFYGATQWYQESTGVDLSQVRFRYIERQPIQGLYTVTNHRIYRDIQEIGTFQLEGGRSQEVADEMIDWLQDLVDTARDHPETLFPAMFVGRQGKLELLDGSHRTAAHFLAGHTHAPVFFGRVDDVPLS